MGFSAARLARIAPWYQGLTTNVADGSKPEKLNASICFPLYPYAQRSRHVRLVPNSEVPGFSGMPAEAVLLTASDLRRADAAQPERVCRAIADFALRWRAVQVNS
jgi:hypothetical protein